MPTARRGGGGRTTVPVSEPRDGFAALENADAVRHLATSRACLAVMVAAAGSSSSSSRRIRIGRIV